ncbi:MAG: DegT/DnrJ/EryC1/StrS family aminotransferase [Bryobacterales bacterium]|nr:DegT/DnrJ/EryC1/StrS family aminotransferase [Bryobacterales bacterium]
MTHEKPRSDEQALAGGSPVRTEPLPLEFPGVHYMDDREIEAVVSVLRARSPFRYYGMNLQKQVECLEAEFAGFLGVNHALAVTSGTGALHTALAALGVGPGHEVIVPAYLWVSVAAAVVNLGAIPVLADIDDTFCLDPSAVRRSITPRTRAVIMVHMSGAPGDVEAVRAVAREHGVYLLEDCAQCAGGSIHGKRVGTFGDMAVFSFQMNKNMTAGEGGCVVTNDRQLYRRAVACHDLGYARDDEGRLDTGDPELCLWGRGYRMDEIRAAILRVQLEKLPATIRAMRNSKYRIRQSLAPFEHVRLRRIIDPAGDTGCFLLTTYADAETAQAVKNALRAEGIVTFPQGVSNIRMTEWGLHLYYNNRSLVERKGLAFSLSENAGLARDYSKGACPVADSLFERSLVLAVPSCLTARDEDDIIRAFEKTLGSLH